MIGGPGLAIKVGSWNRSSKSELNGYGTVNGEDLTSGEKKNPGGGVIMVSTEPADAGFTFSLYVKRPQQFGDLEHPGCVTIRMRLMSFGQDVPRCRLLELVNDANTNCLDILYLEGNTLVWQRNVFFQETLRFDELSRHIQNATFMAAFLCTDAYEGESMAELRDMGI